MMYTSKIAVTSTFFLMLTACGGGSGGSDTSDPSPSTSFATTFSKGPVSGASCSVYQLTSGAPLSAVLASATTDSTGVANFTDAPLEGPALVECSGGSYIDEATGAALEPSMMRAVFDTQVTTTPAVTPLTEIAVQRAEADSRNLLAVLIDYNFDNVLGVDISTVVPADLQLGAAPDDMSGRYATLLAFISQLAANRAVDTPEGLAELIEGLASGDITDQTLAEVAVDLANSDSTAASNISNEILNEIANDLDPNNNGGSGGNSGGDAGDDTGDGSGGNSGGDSGGDEGDGSGGNSGGGSGGDSGGNSDEESDEELDGNQDGESDGNTDGPVANLVAAISDSSTQDTGELRYAVNAGLTRGRFEATILIDPAESESIQVTLYDQATSTSSVIADLRLDEGSISLRDNNGLPESISTSYTPGQAIDVALTWDTSSTTTAGSYSVFIDGQAFGPFAAENSTPGVEVTAFSIRLSSNSATANTQVLVDDFNVFLDQAGNSLLFATDFEGFFAGDNLNAFPFHNRTFSATVVSVEGDLGDIVLDDNAGDGDVNNSGNPSGREDPTSTAEELAIAQSFGLDPTVAPGGNFDLLPWYLNTPAPDSRGLSDRIDEVDLAGSNGFVDPRYFWTAADGGMVFRVTNAGARTSTNTRFPRTELRGMLRRGNTSIRTRTDDCTPNQNNWVFSSAPAAAQAAARGVDGELKATLAVNAVTTTGTSGRVGRVIVGQIHACDDEPIRLYYRKLPGNTRGSIYVAHEIRGGDDLYFEIVGSRDDDAADPAAGIELNEVWSYEILAVGNQLTVTIRSGDLEGEVLGRADINMTALGSDYDIAAEFMYFRAGAYNQNNADDGGAPEDFAQATFYDLDFSHDES